MCFQTRHCKNIALVTRKRNSALNSTLITDVTAYSSAARLIFVWFRQILCRQRTPLKYIFFLSRSRHTWCDLHILKNTKHKITEQSRKLQKSSLDRIFLIYFFFNKWRKVRMFMPKSSWFKFEPSERHIAQHLSREFYGPFTFFLGVFSQVFIIWRSILNVEHLTRDSLTSKSLTLLIQRIIESLLNTMSHILLSRKINRKNKQSFWIRPSKWAEW